MGGKSGESACVLSHVRLFVTSWTIAHQAPLSMGFPRQEYRSGLPFPSPGIEPRSPALQANSLPSEPTEDSGADWIHIYPLSPFTVHLNLSKLCLKKKARVMKDKAD